MTARERLRRGEVERFIAEGEEGRWSRPTIEQMAELCRTWLAVEDAPQADIQMVQCLILSDIDNAVLRMVGQRVKLVVSAEGGGSV